MSTETISRLAENLIRDGNKWLKNDHSELTLTYSFISPNVAGKAGVYGFTHLSAFTDEQKRSTDSLLHNIAKFTGLEFRMASPGEHSNLTFANYSDTTTGVMGFAYLPIDYQQAINSTAIWMNAGKLTSTKDFESVLAHEIGHALGLNHVDTNDPSLLDKENDSVMWPTVTQDGFQSADKYALQKLYGRDTHWQVTYEDINKLRDNAPGKEKAIVEHFLNQLSLYESDLHVTNNPFLTVDYKDATWLHENVNWLYQNTIDATYKNTVLEFWQKLERSAYPLDATRNREDADRAYTPHFTTNREDNREDADRADIPHVTADRENNREEIDRADIPHFTVAYEDINKLRDNAPDKEKAIVKQFLDQLSLYESDLHVTNSLFLTVAYKDITWLYGNISWLYQNTTDAAYKNTVLEFWQKLGHSAYPLDVARNSADADRAYTPHFTATEEDINNNGNQRNEKDHFESSRKVYVSKNIHATNDSSHRKLTLEITISSESKKPYVLDGSTISDSFSDEGIDSRQLPTQHHEPDIDTGALRALIAENNHFEPTTSPPESLTNIENMVSAMSSMMEESGRSSNFAQTHTNENLLYPNLSSLGPIVAST